MLRKSYGYWTRTPGVCRWTANKKPAIECHHCGTPFKGRPNQRYCSATCKRAVEKIREKSKRIAGRQFCNTIIEQEALRVGDHPAVDKIIKKRDRDLAELGEMLRKHNMDRDPVIVTDMLKLLDTWSKAKQEYCYEKFKRWNDRNPREVLADHFLIEELTQSVYDHKTGSYVPYNTWPAPDKARRNPATLSDDLDD